ncbi:hypothetical protein [Falsiroseomonas stagni]|uniref:Uncharacterized protein n=1 Tax=Falsiroseomonas stagni DSM 19981 TaxID=1123062 RepID=A0A1I4A923_9PROT|nr:hypothetical protein [Falsiroseomonas stagni]SFK52885.1 hypothetical protein SAMN02745775_103241 [Falsiroseomonas stagni DSM 19981]
MAPLPPLAPPAPRPPIAASRSAGGAWVLLGLATLGLLALQAMPRAGLPVLMVFPPGLGADRALLGVLGVPGWDPAMVRPLGPFTIAMAAPALRDADVASLRRESGALLILVAFGRAACAARLA